MQLYSLIDSGATIYFCVFAHIDYPRMNEVSATVIIKDLPAHTMEPALYGALAAFSPQNIRLITSRVGVRDCGKESLLICSLSAS